MKGTRNISIGLLLVGLAAWSAVGVTAQEETRAGTAATWVTGSVRFAPSCVDPERNTEVGLTVERGYLCEPQSWDSDDPRLAGTGSARWNADVYWFETERYSVTNALYDVQNGAGGWTCRNNGGLDRGSGLVTYPVGDSDRLTCTGYGDNEGLSAVLVVDWTASAGSFEGLVFDREMPPQPQMPAR